MFEQCAPCPSSFTSWLSLARQIRRSFEIDDVEDRTYVVPYIKAKRVFELSVQKGCELAGLCEARTAPHSDGVVVLDILFPSEQGCADGTRMPASDTADANYHTHPSIDPESITLPSSKDLVTFMIQHLSQKDSTPHSLIFSPSTTTDSVTIYACSVHHVVAASKKTQRQTKKAASAKCIKCVCDYFGKLENMFDDNDQITHDVYTRMFVAACRVLGGIFAIHESTDTL